MEIPGILAIGGAAGLLYSIARAYRSAARVRRLTARNKELGRLLEEKSKSMPWIAKMTADLYWAQDERESQHLETKRHPAHRAAEVVRRHAREKKDLRLEKRLVDYRIALMESLFPWLKEIGFEDAEHLAEAKVREAADDDDPAANWLSEDEWSRLSILERYQRALDRYKQRKKSDWEIGREYERFVGYHWESQGYDVIYYGAIKGFDDFGRDLIVTGKTGKIALIQCKYWSKHKKIPEAAIFQLLGSTVGYYIEKTGYPPNNLQTLFQCVQPYLYSSTKVDSRIRNIALDMGIKLKDDVAMKDWPMVKCNISVGGEKIFHLPMDQQYDRVKISKRGEYYVDTVAEAIDKGFRRAKRWVADAV